MDNKKSFLGRLYDAFFSVFTKEKIAQFLKDKTVKLIVKKLVRSLALTSFWGWIASFVVEELFEEVAQPIINLALRKLGYIVEVENGKKIFKQVSEAQNESDWFDSTRNI